MKHTQTPLHSVLLDFTLVYILKANSTSYFPVPNAGRGHPYYSAPPGTLKLERKTAVVLWDSTKTISQVITYSLLTGSRERAVILL